MRLLTRDESVIVRPHYELSLKYAKRSDCDDAQYGAVIFKRDKVLGEGFNHVPLGLNLRPSSCDDCPRKVVSRLNSVQFSSGIALELCIATHAEQDAINNMYLTRQYKREDTKEATMVVGRIKNGETKIFDYQNFEPNCTRCANKIYDETDLYEIVFSSDMGFLALERAELYQKSICNLMQDYLVVANLGKPLVDLVPQGFARSSIFPS